MRAVVQRVTQAKVTVEEEETGSIRQGLLVFLGVESADTEADVRYMANKITGLRIFEDGQGKMNLSVLDVGGEILAVSQFTLFGDCRHGMRPSFTQAARPEQAKELYDQFVSCCKERDIAVKEGIFQAEMMVSLVNDGPVTMLIDSKKVF